MAIQRSSSLLSLEVRFPVQAHSEKWDAFARKQNFESRNKFLKLFLFPESAFFDCKGGMPVYLPGE